MNIKLLKIQLEELKEAIILYDYAKKDELEQRFIDLQLIMATVYDNIENIIRNNSKS